MLEYCTLEPIKQCRHATKLVPGLKPVTECTDVPKEICSTSRINPKREARPSIQKWCYTPEDVDKTCKKHEDCEDGFVCLNVISKYFDSNLLAESRKSPYSNDNCAPGIITNKSYFAIYTKKNKLMSNCYDVRHTLFFA